MQGGAPHIVTQHRDAGTCGEARLLRPHPALQDVDLLHIQLAISVSSGCYY
jgi:hypothetical protein